MSAQIKENITKKYLPPCAHWIVQAEIQQMRSAWTKWFPNSKPEIGKYNTMITFIT